MSAVKKKARPVIYVGSDKSYWMNICNRYRREYGTIDFDFQTLFSPKEEKTQSLFLDIMRIHPKILYIDFSERSEQHLFLAQLIKRDINFGDIAVVGLVEDKKYVRECISAGVDFIHVKCGEQHDVVYDPMLLAYPKEAKKPQFAKGTYRKDIELIDDFRIGYITPTEIHAEGNLKLEVGEVVTIETAIAKAQVPSKRFKVKKISESDLYYDYKYAYDLEFVFVDEPEFQEDEQDDAIGAEDEAQRLKLIKKAKTKRKLRMAEYENDLKVTMKRHIDWINDKIDLSSPKASKIMIVDKSMRILSEEGIKPLDKYGFGIRPHTFLSENLREIDAIRPNFIAVQVFGEFNDYEELDEEDKLLHEVMKEVKSGAKPARKQDGEEEVDEKEAIREVLKGMEEEELEQLGAIIKKAKELDSYTPFIVLFNCYFQTAEALQQTFQYPLIAVQKEDMKLDVVVGMAQIFQDKQEAKINQKISAKIAELKKRDPMKYRKLTVADFHEKRYFIKKSSELSHGAYSYNIILTEMSESELTFLAEAELGLETYRLKHPVDMSIHIIPNDGKAYIETEGMKQYRALIHSIHEQDKKAIRVFVNEAYFEPLKEKRAQEQAAYWEKHEKIAKERATQEEESSKEKQKDAKETMDANRIDDQAPAGDKDPHDES